MVGHLFQDRHARSPKTMHCLARPYGSGPLVSFAHDCARISSAMGLGRGFSMGFNMRLSMGFGMEFSMVFGMGMT